MTAGSVLADLGVFKTAKQIDYTETLELCDRSIDGLEGLEEFGNLKHVWLCRNELSGLDGIQDNWRLHSLYASQNHISNLEPVSDLLQLEELVVNNNRIEKLEEQLQFLKRLARLRVLDLYNNPLAEETHYRYHVIRTLPSLEVLDRVAVTENERLAAQKVLSKLVLSERRRQPRNSGQKLVVPEWIKNKLKKKRIQLTFTDKRKTGLVDREEFLRVLKRYGVYDEDMVAQFSGDKVDYKTFLRHALPLERNYQHNEVSACVRLAQARALKIKAAREAKEEEEIKAKEEASLLSSMAEESFTFLQPKKETETSGDDDNSRPLTSWELLALKRHLASVNPEDSEASVLESVTEMFGRRCDGVVDIKSLVRLASPSDDGSPSKLLWTLLPAEEARVLADKLFERARKAKDPAEISSLAVRATKLDRIARIKPPPAVEAPAAPKIQLFDLTPFEGIERRKCLDTYKHVYVGERPEPRPTTSTSDILANTGITLTSSYCFIDKSATLLKNNACGKRTQPLSWRTEEIKRPTAHFSYL